MLGEFVTALVSDDAPDNVLGELCRRALTVLSVDGCGMMLFDAGDRLVCAAATDDRVSAIERLQEAAGEGPCSDAVKEGRPVIVADLVSAGRWPRYRPSALAAGVGSVAALPIAAGGERLGVLDVYRNSAGPFSAADLSAARGLAAVAAAYLVQSRERERARVAEERLRGREQFHVAVLDSIPARIAVVGRDGVILAVNADWRKAGGAAGLDAGRHIRDATWVRLGEQATMVERGIQAVLDGLTSRFALDVGDRRDGHEQWYHLQVTRLAGGTRGAVVSYRDITATKQVEVQLFRQATHDPLTGLANRDMFRDRLARAVEATRRSGALAVLFVDVDQFKLVNDSYGHLVGDDLLREVGRRLRDATRPEDTVARFAGDEFVILCEGLDSDLPALGVVERVLRALSAPFRLDVAEVTLTASVGLALHRADEAPVEADALLQAADAAMFEAKSRGGGQYAVYSDALRRESRQRLELTQALRRALAAEELRLHYQPLVDLRSGRVVGLEALSRWPSPAGAMRPAAECIDLAAESGLIIGLDRWALDTACAQAAAWTRAGFPPPRLAINVSAARLADPSLVPDVHAALAGNALAPQAICLEITETAVMNRLPQVTGTLRELHGLGVRVALDDFGTGQSSLAYLEQFPVDVVKLDRSFVARLGPPDAAGAPDPDRSGRDLKLLTGLIGLGAALDLSVVVEGIETRAQLDWLRGLPNPADGPLVGQGYQLAMPAAHRRPPRRVRLAS